MNAKVQFRFSLEDYLAWENVQDTRNEFHDGEVFAMVGGRREHGLVVSNLNGELRNALKGSPCRAFAESMKVQVGTDTILYPDVFVTCDRADLATEMIFRSPGVVIEVLSPTTERYDRGIKFGIYRRLPSLREYVLIDPETRSVEAFRIDEQGRWVLYDMTAGSELRLPALDIAIPLAEVFDGVDPPLAEAPQAPA